MSLSDKSRTSIDVRFAMLSLSVPDRPLLCRFSLVVKPASLHVTPYKEQWLIYRLFQCLSRVHLLPFAPSKFDLRAFCSGGHMLEFLPRSNFGNKEQRSIGAGIILQKAKDQRRLE